MLQVEIIPPPIVREKLTELGPAIVEELDAQDTDLVSFIVSEELHGQILHQQSGKLAGSVRTLPAEQQGDIVTGSVQAGGGPAWYAELFEHGESIDIYPVKAKALRFVIGGEVFFRKHIHLDLPRPFMAPAQTSQTPVIIAGIERRIGEVLGA